MRLSTSRHPTPPDSVLPLDAFEKAPKFRSGPSVRLYAVTIEALSNELREAPRRFAGHAIGPIVELEDRSRSFGRMSLV